MSGSPCRWKILRQTREYIVEFKIVHPSERKQYRAAAAQYNSKRSIIIDESALLLGAILNLYL